MYLLLSIIFAVFLSFYEPFHTFLLHLGKLGYLGAFIAGVLFVSTFTVATGIIILLVLAESLSPVELGIIAGFGAVFGDYVIFRFIKDNLLEEITPIYTKIGGTHLTAILHTKYFSWTLPVIGAVIIATPFPDEIGVSLMGIAKMSTFKFMLVSFILNAVGIFFVVSAATVIKP
jgi:hypothetical protein